MEEDNKVLAEAKSVRCAAIEFAFRVLSGTEVSSSGRVAGLLEASKAIEEYINSGAIPQKDHDNAQLQ